MAKTKDETNDDGANDGTPGDASGDGAAAGADGGAAPDGRRADDGGDSLGDRIEGAVRKVFDDVLGRDDDDDGGDVTTNTPPATNGSTRSIEAEAERTVREAFQRVEHEKAVDDRLTNVEKKIEKAPQKVSRLTRAFWGDPNG